jgi:hypothetical protein
MLTWRQGKCVLMKRFDIGTALPAAAIEVADAGSGTLAQPAVDMAATGEAVVAWENDSDGPTR